MQILSTNLINELFSWIRPWISSLLTQHIRFPGAVSDFSRAALSSLRLTTYALRRADYPYPSQSAHVQLLLQHPKDTTRRNALSRARLARARRPLGEDARRMGHPPPLASTCLREPLRESARMVCICICICAMCSVRVLNCLLGPLYIYKCCVH